MLDGLAPLEELGALTAELPKDSPLAAGRLVRRRELVTYCWNDT